MIELYCYRLKSSITLFHGADAQEASLAGGFQVSSLFSFAFFASCCRGDLLREVRLLSWGVVSPSATTAAMMVLAVDFEVDFLS